MHIHPSKTYNFHEGAIPVHNNVSYHTSHIHNVFYMCPKQINKMPTTQQTATNYTMLPTSTIKWVSTRKIKTMKIKHHNLLVADHAHDEHVETKFESPEDVHHGKHIYRVGDFFFDQPGLLDTYGHTGRKRRRRQQAVRRREVKR